MRLSLSNKISATIIVMGIFGLLLVYYSSISYRQLVYEHQQQAIKNLARLEVDRLLQKLRDDTVELALSVEGEQGFTRHVTNRDTAQLVTVLDNQFQQYFVTAGVLKLLKLYVLDANFTLLAQSANGIATDEHSGLICTGLSRQAQQRRGAEKLQIMSRICNYRQQPVYAALVPFGGLSPRGYILVINDLAYTLQSAEKNLGMPVKILAQNRQPLYVSDNWPATASNNTIIVNLPIKSYGIDILTLSLQVNMVAFNRELNTHRNLVLSLALVIIIGAVLVAMSILKRSEVQPLSRVMEVIEKIQSSPADSLFTGRLLFEQLLEQIIQLRKNRKNAFAVMLIDLTRFKQVNIRYGKEAGDELLRQIETRLNTILRDSDKISWVGTDTPGHKLLPADAKTFYRATLARLGGDEFGLVLPSAKNHDQVKAVARRIIEKLGAPYTINGETISINCKIGISLFPEHGDDEHSLIRFADKAMFLAKQHSTEFFIYQSDETPA